MISETEVQLLQLRVAELEERLKFVYRHLNIDFAQPNADPLLSPAVQEALRSGNKIARSNSSSRDQPIEFQPTAG